MVWSLFPVFILATLIVGGVLVAVRDRPPARPWIILGVASALALPAAIVLHNLVSALIGGEEAVFFIVGLLVAPTGLAIGTLGAGLAIARDGRERELGASLLLAGGGIGLFALYALFALVVTTIEGGNPPYQAQLEAVVIPLSSVATAAGAIASAISAARRSTRGRRLGPTP